MYDLIIIGGGPAGLTAGLYNARARLNVLLLERLAPGGQVLTTDWVENYPGFPDGISGFDLMEKMKIEFHTDLEVQQFTSTIPTGIVEDLRTDGKSIILTFSRENLIEIIGVLNQVGKVRDLDIKSPDLEDIFMKYYETSQSGAGSLKTRKIQNEEVD